MNATFFFIGLATATFAASGLFFFKFWRVSRDRFFLLFGLACWLLAIERILAYFVHSYGDPVLTAITENTPWVYFVRLFAFLLILWAIVIKNRQSRPS